MAQNKNLKIAAAAYPLNALESEQKYREKITIWVQEAYNNGANLLVFPEYGGMELASLAGKEAAADMHRSIDAVSERLDMQAELHRELAAEFNVFIVSASGPCRHADGTVTNVARLFAPGGKQGDYHKIMPTPGERDPFGISPGPVSGLKVYDIGIAKIGLLICYDIEFPLLSRALAEAGAQVILAPSNTEKEHGYWRVRTGCMARALENQVYTVHAPTVGDAPWCKLVDENTGAAGIFGPSDEGLPAGGVVALGDMNEPGWVYADLDLDLIEQMRLRGAVQTYNHWSEQPGAGPLPSAEVVRLV